MSKLSVLRHMTARDTGISLRTLHRHPEATIDDLRGLISLFRNRPMVRAAEFARIMQIPRSTVYGWIQFGKLEAYQVFSSTFIPLDQKVLVMS